MNHPIRMVMLKFITTKHRTLTGKWITVRVWIARIIVIYIIIVLLHWWFVFAHFRHNFWVILILIFYKSFLNSRIVRFSVVLRSFPLKNFFMMIILCYLLLYTHLKKLNLHVKCSSSQSDQFFHIHTYDAVFFNICYNFLYFHASSAGYISISRSSRTLEKALSRMILLNKKTLIQWNLKIFEWSKISVCMSVHKFIQPYVCEFMFPKF